MPRRSAGIAGSAVLVGTAGLYLVYVGIRDVPLVDGLRSLLNKQIPTARESHEPYKAPASGISGAASAAAGIVSDLDRGSDKLVGNAKAAYPIFRAMGKWVIYGWGLRPDLSSDHPKGLAMDIMNPTPSEAQAIIAKFKTLPGAKYWIWNRQIANVSRENWKIRPYSGPNPHIDHVHLSFS